MFLAGAGMFSMRLYPVQDDAFRQNVVEELRYQGEKTQPPGRGEVRIEINHFAKTGSGQTSKGRAPKKTAPPVYRFSSSDPADAPPRDCPLGFEQRGKETASFAPFFTKQDHVLQRQARDKHRESTHKRGVFSYRTTATRRFTTTSCSQRSQRRMDRGAKKLLTPVSAEKRRQRFTKTGSGQTFELFK
jgi:hypothetical protein